MAGAVADVVGQLTVVVVDLERQRARVAAAVAMLNRAHDQVRGLTGGQRHPRLDPVLGRIRLAVDRFAEADRLLVSAMAAVAACRRTIDQAVSGPVPGVADATAARPVSAATAGPGMEQRPGVPVPVVAGWRRAGDVPAVVGGAGDGFRPRLEGNVRPTVGVFNGEQVVSGGGDRSVAAELDHGPLRGPPVTFYDHAESKVAARMRRDGIMDGDLAVDNTVCGTNERDRDYQWTCEKVLPSILPPGSRLRVWVTRDGGRTWWQHTYLGTGERIRS